MLLVLLGESITLKPDIIYDPPQQEEVQFTYQTNNSNTSVNSNGKVVGLAVGESIITITSSDNNQHFSEIPIKVIELVGLINNEVTSINKDEKTTLTPELEYSDGSKNQLFRFSSNFNMDVVDIKDINNVQTDKDHVFSYSSLRDKDGNSLGSVWVKSDADYHYIIEPNYELYNTNLADMGMQCEVNTVSNSNNGTGLPAPKKSVSTQFWNDGTENTDHLLRRLCFKRWSTYSYSGIFSGYDGNDYLLWDNLPTVKLQFEASDGKMYITEESEITLLDQEYYWKQNQNSAYCFLNYYQRQPVKVTVLPGNTIAEDEELSIVVSPETPETDTLNSVLITTLNW